MMMKGCIYVGDGKSVEVETIKNFMLLLSICYYLDLMDTFVVLSFRLNLTSGTLMAYDKSTNS